RSYGVRLLAEASSPAECFARYDRVRTLVATRAIELPPHPVLVADLKSIRKKALSGSIRVELARTSDGRHADFAPALALAVERALIFASAATGGVGLGAGGGPRAIRTSFGSGLGGGFMDWDGARSPGARVDGTSSVLVRGMPGTQPKIINIPSAPRGPGRGW